MGKRTGSGYIAAAVAAAGLLAAMVSAPAYAQTERPSAPRANDIAKSSDGYCVYDLDRGAQRCSPTEAGAKALARGKRTVMTAWGKPGWKGKWFNFVSSAGCKDGQFVGKHRNLRKVHANLPRKKNWNNRMSSLEMRKGCEVQLHGKALYKGHHTKWLGTTKRLGRVPDPGDNWNNAASSFLIVGS